MCVFVCGDEDVKYDVRLCGGGGGIGRKNKTEVKTEMENKTCAQKVVSM